MECSLVGFDDAVQNGFNTWSALQQLTYTQRTLGSSNSGQWGGNADGINNVVWIPTSTEWENIDRSSNQCSSGDTGLDIML